ncbi:MAG TPA: DUF4167 domain-containing protein [Xanthobacteraceae bacterium]|nr:DUF4167 domain-containing protein [Xanthobacteraceae bacterium]
MRNGQNKRMRGRNRKNQNPLTRVYESNGPDVKIRGTASHVAEKYVQLARDAQASGDPVAAENYFQHAEHYFRLIAAAQEQFRQGQPFYRPEGGAADPRDDAFDDSEDEVPGYPGAGGEQPTYGTRDPQPYLPRDAQFYPPREGQPYGGRQPQGGGRGEDSGNVDRLPSFITGGGQPQGHQANGHDNQGGDRFPLHRRRRRHRGPRGDMPGAAANMATDGGDEPGPQGP